jgi:hypothetical protein
MLLAPSMLVGFHADTPPVGSFEIASPLPTPTQKLVLGHDTAFIRATLLAAVQAAAPPDGLVELTKPASLSTPTHSVLPAHDTPVMTLPTNGG